MARCARSPELRGDSDRLGVARVRTRATTPGLSPPCWFRARAIDEQRSVARPSGCWWLAACDIHMLPLTSKIKGETRTPIFYHSLKLEITFCVQGVSRPLPPNRRSADGRDTLGHDDRAATLLRRIPHPDGYLEITLPPPGSALAHRQRTAAPIPPDRRPSAPEWPGSA